ncbi:DUF86 domain-containing protein [Flagellimonas allohymeniacidonis]|uniref:DUF86 domain-containing protein n=1 Tax=Flagellimonas allohymeniacidonis TaxID=2517819 RepID=A0A4Q8QJD6_9FLAO|nr:DUF86 domain-containing protein [Allomuricauda hymeniacidonis]TAI48346.1 DUF86 domain-containing protein [Allomuricauda hymeniacidonis]
MSKRDNSLLLLDMLEGAEKILKYTSDLNYESFLDDEMVIDAVARNFEIIGEAANRIDPDFQSAHPQIEWQRITGFRNRIIHEYFGIDYEIMWTIIQENIGELIDELKELIN